MLDEPNIAGVPVVADERMPEGVVALVQPILTVAQAELIQQAVVAFLNSPGESISEDEDEVIRIKQELSEQAYFWSVVVDNPGHFGLRSKTENKQIVRAATRVPGPAQPPRNKRKRSQRERPSYLKRTRAEKRAEAENYNEARAKMESEQKESEEAYERAKQGFIDRFEALAAKEVLTTEEFQEALELFDMPGPAQRVRELQAENTPEARIAAAQAKAEKEVDPFD